MPKKTGVSSEEKTVELLQQLLAIELWRGGLSQVAIARRLGMGTQRVNEILKGVRRDIAVTASE